MIPIRDSTPRRHFPVVTLALVVGCSAGFAWEILQGPGLDGAMRSYALIPSRFLTLGRRDGFFLPELYTPFATSLFLHGDVLHFGVNMLFLWVFGDPVEDRLGRLHYLGFYLAGGALAGLAHVAAHPHSTIPTIGASGAIAAVMGAYLLLYPRAWVVSFVPPFFWWQFRVPALLYLVAWFGLQLYMGSLALREPTPTSGVAWWAHAGGFAFGVATVVALGRRAARR